MTATLDSETLDSRTLAGTTGAMGARGRIRQALALAPYARYARFAPKNPMVLGALALGAAGVLAWRHREKIAQTARPLLRNAADAGQQMRERLPWTRAADPAI